MSSFDTPYTGPQPRRGGVDGLIDAARDLFRSREDTVAAVQERGRELGENARVAAGRVATHVKQKPIPPALILLGVGIGLTLLFNKRARDATISAGGYALNQYKKYR